jgi:hypothetical protein
MAGFGPASLDQNYRKRFAIRGREQQLVDHFRHAQSEGGTLGNRIRRISKQNPFGRIYRHATKAFGEYINPVQPQVIPYGVMLRQFR